MRIGILTSTETRHRYFVNAIRAGFPVVAVGYEDTDYSPAATPKSRLSPAEQATVDHHFRERARQEEEYFGHNACWVDHGLGVGVRHIAPGGLNTDHTLRHLAGRGADTIVVFGTNLIREPLISHWPGRMLNMHLGLSPYYRGTATNFYPLVNGEPQCVGATIHLIDQGIDSGPIVRHARPTIVADDTPHTIGCKAILAGIEAMKESLRRLERDGALVCVAQWKVPGARLYLRRDYDPRHVVDLCRKIDAGLVKSYIADPQRQRPPVGLVP